MIVSKSEKNKVGHSKHNRMGAGNMQNVMKKTTSTKTILLPTKHKDTHPSLGNRKRPFRSLLDEFWLNSDSLSFLFSSFFFLMFIFETERGRAWVGEGQRKRDTHRIQSRLQALSCQHTAGRGAWTRQLRDHDLSQNRMLDWVSHPGVPGSLS